MKLALADDEPVRASAPRPARSPVPHAHRVAEAASESLARATPDFSAKRAFTVAQLVFLAATAAGLGWLAWREPAAIARAAEASAFVIFATLIVWRLFAAAAVLTPLPPPPGRWTGDLPIYTILCPLYREANMLAALSARLAALDYPADKLDLKIVLESDDFETIAAADAIAWPAHAEVLLAPAGKPRTKPKALNFALAFARGKFVTIFDAEDAPDPGQLRAALDAFAAGGEDLACVQAPLLIDNAGASWLAGQFAAEYAIQFRATLPLLARLGRPLMLGGTSNHFRTHALASCGGWDPYNVTEDADIGYRLAREGWRATVIAPPTWEEAPVRLRPWLRQRTRWLKGHMQTWLVLMRDPWRTAREMGFASFLAMQLMLPGALLSSFAHAPAFIAVLIAALLPQYELSWLAWTLTLAGYCTAVYGALATAAVLRDPRVAASALTMPFYWPLSTLAAFAALGELVFRPHYWAKTTHGVSRRGR